MKGSSKIVLEGVSKRYGKIVALRDASLTLNEEVLVVLGPNGSGKSTLIKLAAGILKPDEGEVRLIYKRAAYVPEVLPTLDPLVKVYDLIALYGSISGGVDLSPFELLGIRDAISRKYGELSKGTRRKVLLALALGIRADVLLLDEPFLGLDPPSCMALSEALNGKTAIVVTHMVEDIPRYFSRILVIHEGSIVGEMRGVPTLVKDPGKCDKPVPLGEGLWICVD